MIFQPVFRFRHTAKLVMSVYGDGCRNDLRVLNCTQYLFSRFVRFYSSIESDVPNEDNLEKNIIFNSLLHKHSFLQKKRLERRAEKKSESENLKDPVPISLKYVLTPEEEANFVKDRIVKTEATVVPDCPVRLPYTLKTSPRSSYGNSSQNENYSEKNELMNNILASEMSSVDSLISDLPVKTAGRWMNDYEKYTEEEEENGAELESWRSEYGTPDPTVPVSQVPCGGCGAHLHCQDYAIPGFLPREIFVNCTEKDLQAAICQRCYFLQNYNTALSVTVDKEEYPRLLSRIKDERALIILIADMTDLPHSFWPDILNIVGRKRPMFVVGNKTDLLWPDSKGWMTHALCCLKACLPVGANVKYISLISAKTGFGIEQLINKLHNIWQYKGDVYLVGCTNVGKSTLFNALLQSDYCKVKAVDLVQRATTAPWPGTTLNLLKFPILRPEGWRLYLRVSRLHRQAALESEERAHSRELKRATKSKKIEAPQLLGHIGRTFHQSPSPQDVEAKDSFSVSKGSPKEPPGLGLDESDPDYRGTRWLFDTPGVLHEHQFLDLLTAEEVTLVLPKKTLEPRTFSMRVGWSLFVGGVARIDYVQGNNTIRLTVFSADSLPVTIVPLDKASEMYTQLIGSGYMAVPRGSQERLQTWPGLQLAAETPLSGLIAEESCADISLSSAGWVSVTPRPKEVIRLAVWTPQARGVSVRCPSLLPFAALLRGKKIRNSPAYTKSKPYIL